jgi:proteasome assembly chaperone (PAC2) family protein
VGDALTIYATEPLRDPVLVLSYAGWSDGGDAATMASKSLLQQFSMTRHAAIDTEEFLDFTVVRPHVRLRDGEQREIVWPDHEFFGARLESGSSDLLVGLGVEPHLRWRAYARNVLELVEATKARLVVLMGAYLDEVIYSQPVQVSAYGAPHELFQGLELATPSYEGPTGILGVLGDALRREGVPMASLWARIPHYVPTRPNARGALALLHALEGIAGLRLDLSELEREAGEFDDTVSQLIATDPQLLAYVKELKRRVFSQ